MLWWGREIVNSGNSGVMGCNVRVRWGSADARFHDIDVWIEDKGPGLWNSQRHSSALSHLRIRVTLFLVSDVSETRRFPDAEEVHRSIE